MTTKVYCLKYPDDIGTNPDMTLNIHKAMEWLDANKEYACQVLEFLVSDDKVSDMWERCWFYYEDRLHSLKSGDYIN